MLYQIKVRYWNPGHFAKLEIIDASVLLIQGSPHHIELKSQAFDDPSQNQQHTAKLFSNCYLSAHVQAFVCDKSGNKTPIKTTLNLSWIPGSCGLMTSKKTTQAGEATFQGDTIKCASPRNVDQEVKLKVSSSEHRNLQVSK